MNKELVMIGGGVSGGAVSNGLVGLFPATANQMLVNGGMALAAGFGITKISGTDAKSNFLRSALIGATIVRGIALVKNVFEKTGVAAKLTAPTKVNQFLLGATGLGCPYDAALNGMFVDQDGNEHYIDGLNAMYIDENGNEVHALNGYEEEAGLFGFDDDQDDALNGYEEEAGLYGVSEKSLLY